MRSGVLEDAAAALQAVPRVGGDFCGNRIVNHGSEHRRQVLSLSLGDVGVPQVARGEHGGEHGEIISVAILAVADSVGCGLRDQRTDNGGTTYSAGSAADLDCNVLRSR